MCWTQKARIMAWVKQYEDECTHIFLLEAEKAQFDNRSNEGMQENLKGNC